MNTKLIQKVKNNFDKDFLNVMNNAVFEKTKENVRQHRNIKLLITETKRYCLVSKPNYHNRKFFTEHLLAVEMRQNQMLINKSIYLGLSILDLSKIVMYEFWFDYEKPKYCENTKLCYIDTDR